jgi:hypothetical protein
MLASNDFEWRRGYQRRGRQPRPILCPVYSSPPAPGRPPPGPGREGRGALAERPDPGNRRDGGSRRRAVSEPRPGKEVQQDSSVQPPGPS